MIKIKNIIESRGDFVAIDEKGNTYKLVWKIKYSGGTGAGGEKSSWIWQKIEFEK